MTLLATYLSVCTSQLSSSLECGRGVHGQDMHTELEMYANRLAEAEQRQRAMSTPDLLVCFFMLIMLIQLLVLYCFPCLKCLFLILTESSLSICFILHCIRHFVSVRLIRLLSVYKVVQMPHVPC